MLAPETSFSDFLFAGFKASIRNKMYHTIWKGKILFQKMVSTFLMQVTFTFGKMLQSHKYNS